MSFELTAGPLPIVSAISYLYGLEVVKCELTMSQYADPVRPEKALDGFADVSVDSPGASAMLVKVSHFQRHGMLRFLGDGHSRRQNGSARRSLRIIKTEIGISERIAHKPGKREVMIYDYADLEVPMRNRIFQRRMRGYRQLGYTIHNEQGHLPV